MKTGGTLGKGTAREGAWAVCDTLCVLLLPLLIKRANDVVAESQSPFSMLATPAANDADGVDCCRAVALTG